MARECPVCEKQPMQVVNANDVEIDVCPTCGGMWFDAGELEMFPERPSVTHFLAAARHAPNRCRKSAHPLGRALNRCPTCQSAPALCPVCGARLAHVPTPACAIDVCAACEGVWLDAGEFELLQGVKGPPEPPAGKPAAGRRGWVVPPATELPGGKDPWTAPGHATPGALGSQVDPRRPFSCRHCGAGLPVADAWAFEGETYCAACRPAGAISGRSLPPDLLVPSGGSVDYHPSFGFWGDVLRPLVDFWTRLRR